MERKICIGYVRSFGSQTAKAPKSGNERKRSRRRAQNRKERRDDRLHRIVPKVAEADGEQNGVDGRSCGARSLCMGVHRSPSFKIDGIFLIILDLILFSITGPVIQLFFSGCPDRELDAHGQCVVAERDEAVGLMLFPNIRTLAIQLLRQIQ